MFLFLLFFFVFFLLKWRIPLFFFRYGTPYLISLDLSKEMTALVWLAGPLSGLLVQPVSFTTVFFIYFFIESIIILT
jgi:hypothetical protein